MNNVVKSFNILAISLSVLHNHFDSSTKLFSDLNLAKFLDTSVKSFFIGTLEFMWGSRDFEEYSNFVQ